MKGVTNYCIAVNWYYLAAFWVDSLLWYGFAGVMVLWRFCDGVLMAIISTINLNYFKSEIHRCESVCQSVCLSVTFCLCDFLSVFMFSKLSHTDHTEGSELGTSLN
jgi:D-alanyl-lipoteichoic acid acyltransferase DltB (MBOAT superfamily)